MSLVGICGSMRKDSYNLKLLKEFKQALPNPDALEIVTLHDVPFYNEDVEVVGFPSSVVRLSSRIKDAGTIIFAAPEYNYSIPGVLKNAIDWVSRHPDKPFAGKKAAIIGASPGRFGASRCHYHLRQVGVTLDLRFINQPEVMVGEINKKFSPDGRLNDAFTQDLLKKLAVLIG